MLNLIFTDYAQIAHAMDKMTTALITLHRNKYFYVTVEDHSRYHFNLRAFNYVTEVTIWTEFV